MEDVLWHLLASSRGGPSRVRLLRAIHERPRNANHLAEALDLDYRTLRHHLDRLLENNVVRSTEEDYGAVYPVTDQAQFHWETIEAIMDTVDPENSDSD
jgi:DNA-binding transcriptional ArsR family regulator